MTDVLADESGCSIAEAAEHLGLSTDTLRYYERDGLLLQSVGRASSGHRRYTSTDLSWITMITRLRSTGMPIREVRRTPPCAAPGTATSTKVCREGGRKLTGMRRIVVAARARRRQ